MTIDWRWRCSGIAWFHSLWLPPLELNEPFSEALQSARSSQRGNVDQGLGPRDCCSVGLSDQPVLAQPPLGQLVPTFSTGADEANVPR